jgi:hypothetical protein
MEFVVTYAEWSRTRQESFFVHARDLDHARSLAYWALGDLIDIVSVEEFT